jgi:hypothetical protein
MILCHACRIAVPFMGFLLLGSLALPAATHAQAGSQEISGCSVFEDCALRVQYGFLRTEVVRGTEDIRVARIGLGTPALDELFSRSDTAALSFESFRVDHRRSSWLKVLGGVEIAAGLIARSRDNEDWARALSVSGIVLELVGMVFRTRADEHLSRAIWWYNESLTLGGIG